MRQIKFRGKRTDNGEWIEGYYAYKDLSEEHFIIMPTFDSQGRSYRPQFFTDYLVDPETVCQWTSLKDCNGNYIYEGDIIRCHDVCTQDHEITFTDGVFCLDGIPSSNFYHNREDISVKWEVIGSVYENPELLNPKG